MLSLLAGLPPLDTSLFASTIPPNLIGGYGQSWANVGSRRRFRRCRSACNFSLPIRNRTAEANAAVAAAEGKRLRALRDQAEMLIEADVRNSLQTASSAQARYAASILARQSAEEQYASEQRQLQVRHVDRVSGAAAPDRSDRRPHPRSARASRPRVAAANLDRATASTLDTLKIGIK